MLSHYYFEYFDKTEILIFGRIHTEGVKTPIQKWDLKLLNQIDFQTIISEHLSDAEIMLFIHGYWSKYARYARHHNKVFSRVYQGSNKKAILIELIWQSCTLGYKRSWHQAVKKGEQLGHIIYWLSNMYAKRMSIMCHSMGGKFFEGILKHYDIPDSPFFDNIILFSVDLDAHVFDTSFNKVSSLAQKVSIFYNRFDKILLLAQFLQRKKRLGIVGDLTHTLSENVYSYDMSHIRKYTDTARHSLFWTNPDVQEDMRELLVSKHKKTFQALQNA